MRIHQRTNVLSFIQILIRRSSYVSNCQEVVPIGKTDVKSAFRNLCIRPQDWCLLIMKARSPIDGKVYYFVDKCLPFGASISCSHFQQVSDAMAHIFRARTDGETVNYLDDYFFAAIIKALCDNFNRYISAALRQSGPAYIT